MSTVESIACPRHNTARRSTSTLSLHDALPILLVSPLMVTSTVGCRPSGVQTSPCEVPLGPTSEVSMKAFAGQPVRSEEHTSELQSRPQLVCRLLLEKKNQHPQAHTSAIGPITQ